MATFTPGPTQAAQHACTPSQCLSLFLVDEILDEIVKWTNVKVEVMKQKYKLQTNTHSNITRQELQAFIGILILSGCQRDNHLSTREMWDPAIGTPIYRATMSRARFEFLVDCLRFDDPDTREQRRQTDRLAPIRYVWDMFTRKCQEMYIPSDTLTIDEQLLAFRGRCLFRMYIPNKPAKYGIKLVLICDNESKYLLGGIPYLGRGGTNLAESTNLGHYFVKELTRPYHNSHRNVTTDNWFTSVPLASDLLNNCGLTLVGTIKGVKKEIPTQMKITDNRAPGSTAFLYTKEMTLVSYVPDRKTTTKKKMVLLLSTMHNQGEISDRGKPEIIEYYNRTKGGVDTFDQMTAMYSTSRKTRRWPLCLMYGIVNAATLNSWIIYNAHLKVNNMKPLVRRTYMQQLAIEWITPWAEHRIETPSLSRELRLLISSAFKIPSPGTAADSGGPVAAESAGPTVRCRDCPKGSDRKTRHKCHMCKRPVCPKHYYPVCPDCVYLKVIDSNFYSKF